MNTSELRQAIKSLNLAGVVSLDFSRDNSDGKDYIVVIGDKKLFFETSKEQNKVYNLLTSKFGFERYTRNPFDTEEERGYYEGWAADMANPKEHGRTLSVSLTAEGTGEHRVWDYYQQKAVNKADLSQKDKSKYC